jgi:hypothetical protein
MQEVRRGVERGTVRSAAGSGVAAVGRVALTVGWHQGATGDRPSTSRS